MFSDELAFRFPKDLSFGGVVKGGGGQSQSMGAIGPSNALHAWGMSSLKLPDQGLKPRRVQLEPETARRVGVFWHVVNPFNRDRL